MPEEKTPEQIEAEKKDGLGNLKSEIDRKFGNFSDELKSVTEMNQKILTQLEANNKPKSKPKENPSEDYETLMYDNPAEYTRRVKAEAKTEFGEELDKREQYTRKFREKQTNVLTQIVQEYPELSDASNPLTKKTLEKFNAMSEEDRALPISYKVAAYEAASELGILTKAKRNKIDEEEEDFTMAANSGSKRPTKRTSGQDEKMLRFAKYMGVDITDKKTVARLKERSNRNWNEYK